MTCFLKKQLPTVRAISISFVNEQTDNSGINGETPRTNFRNYSFAFHKLYKSKNRNNYYTVITDNKSWNKPVITEILLAVLVFIREVKEFYGCCIL